MARNTSTSCTGQGNNTTSGRHIMWMIPRTTSTAMTMAMSRVPDVDVWFEPFAFANFAIRSLKIFRNEELPLEYEGNELAYEAAGELLSSVTSHAKMNTDLLSYDNIKRALEQSTSKFVFVKDECSMVDGKYQKYLPEGYSHSFLIRHPVLAYSSMRSSHYMQSRDGGLLKEGETNESMYDLRKNVTFYPHDVYYQCLHSHWKYIRENIDPNPVIIDSSDLLSKPAELLPKYCEAIGFPFSESLLDLDISIEELKKWHWPADDLVEKQGEAFFTQCVSNSSFRPPKTPLPRDQLPDDVIELSDAAMPYYQEMFENRLKV